eukprot:3537498-Rhodomonas_salina.2
MRVFCVWSVHHIDSRVSLHVHAPHRCSGARCEERTLHPVRTRRGKLAPGGGGGMRLERRRREAAGRTAEEVRMLDCRCLPERAGVRRMRERVCERRDRERKDGTLSSEEVNESAKMREREKACAGKSECDSGKRTTHHQHPQASAHPPFPR